MNCQKVLIKHIQWSLAKNVNYLLSVLVIEHQMLKKEIGKQTLLQGNGQDSKGSDTDIVQIEALRVENLNLKQQNATLRKETGDRKIVNCEWQLKYIQADFENKAKAINQSSKNQSSDSLNKAKEAFKDANKVLDNLRQQLQQQKTKFSVKSKRDGEQLKELKSTVTSLEQQLAEAKMRNTNLNTFIETYKQNELSIIKFKEVKEEASARTANFERERAESIENQTKIIKDQMKILKTLKDNTEEKERRKADDSKKYAKLIQEKDTEIATKLAEIAKLQNEATENTKNVTFFNNSVINFLIELTSFEKVIGIIEPEKAQLLKGANLFNSWKRQQKLILDWEKAGKHLLNILATSIRKQKERMKNQGENEKKDLSDIIKGLYKASLQQEKQIKQLTEQITKGTKSQGELLTQKKDLNEKLKQKISELETVKVAHEKLKKDKTTLETQLQSSIAQGNKLKNDLSEERVNFDKYRKTKEPQLQNAQNNIKELIIKGEKLAANLQALKTQNEEKQAIIRDLGNQKNTLQVKERQLTTKVSQLQGQKSTLQLEKQKLQSEKASQKTNIESLQRQLAQLKNINSDLNRVKIQLTKDVQSSGRQKNDLTTLNAKIDREYQEKARACASLERELENQQAKFSQFASVLAIEILQKNSKINVKQAKLPEVAKELITVYKQARFFNGSEIIPPERVNFILDALWDLTKCRCKGTKLIYRLDSQNTSNFHLYIDKKENLLVVVKLSNGSIVGGFTNTTLETGVSSSNGKGFCFNLNHERVFKPRNGTSQNVTTYDSFYFILGNAEIRLRTGEKKIFSNFGIARSYFDNLDFPRTDFLGVTKAENNELDIESYEFYKIDFDYE